MKNIFRISLFSLVVLLSGCAHGYTYMPETEGDGVIHSHGGIHSVPPEKTRFKFKLTSLGVSQGMMGIRMYVRRTGPDKAVQGYLDPKEQVLSLPDSGLKILPARVHASTEKKPLVSLTSLEKQAVEIYFRLPEKMKAGDIQAFTLNWKVHYGKTGSEAQATRFDRRDSRPQEGSEMFPGDADYPYDESPVLPPGWFRDDWSYWEI